MSSAVFCLFVFFKFNFFKEILSGTLSGCKTVWIQIRTDTLQSECLNCLNPDQDRHSVSTDLGPNCLQRLSADNEKVAASKERVITILLRPLNLGNISQYMY